MNEVVENAWNDGIVVNFEIQAGLLGESKQLFHNGSGCLLEDRVDTGVDQSGVTLSILLCNQNLVLNMEVGDVIFQIHIF